MGMVSVAEFGASNAVVLLCKLELWVRLNILERMQGQAAYMVIQQSQALHGSASWPIVTPVYTGAHRTTLPNPVSPIGM